MPHRSFQEMRARFVALSGTRPTPPGTVSRIESALGVNVPEDFLRVCEFYDGTGVVSESMARVSDLPSHNTVRALTEQFRTELALPANYLVLGATEDSVLLLDCAPKRGNGAPGVHRILRPELPRLVLGQSVNGAQGWNTFTDFFRQVLDQEEAN